MWLMKTLLTSRCINQRGAGQAFIAPAITALFYSSLGAGGVLGIYAGLYILSGVLTPFLKTPEELNQQAELKDKVA